MTSTWFLLLGFLIYPSLILWLNSLVRHRIPDKIKRRAFKKKKDYVINMVYLITPLLLFHVELFYLNAGYLFNEINKLTLIVLFSLQVFLLLNAIKSLYQLIAQLKNYDE